MVPARGFIRVITGGIVSFGPPLGGVVVFAHECENITEPRMKATGMIGSRLLKYFFMFYIIRVPFL